VLRQLGDGEQLWHYEDGIPLTNVIWKCRTF